MITVFGGKLGSGKTLRCVQYGKWYSTKKFKVFANFDVEFAEKINPLALIDYKLNNCVCLFDEWDTFFDSRISSSKTNRLQSYFYKQTRKRNVHILGNAQFLRRIDYTARDLAEYRFLCNAHYKTVGKNRVPEFFDLYYENIWGDFKPYKRNTAQQLEPYYKMYNTDEIILPFHFKKPVKFRVVEQLYDESQDKKKFALFMRVEYRYLSKTDCNDIFDLMELNETKRVERVISDLS